MCADLSGIEPVIYKSGINVPYHWWAGDTASAFLTALRDRQTITAIKCGSCGMVFVPPRKTCPQCFTPNTQWLEVGPLGTVTAFTVARKQLAAIKDTVPVVFALVKLDGASTSMLHKLLLQNPSLAKAGMRVKPRFAQDRTGTILDIQGFEPA
jgi:uncharacterized OB-fold protein